MPSTITTYYSFQPGTKARSSEVNTNFSNYRGDLLPINETTITASDNSHDLGKSDHYWKTAYVKEIDFRTSTSTATLILSGDTSATAGSFDFSIEGAKKFQVNSLGPVNPSYSGTALTPRRMQRKLITSTTASGYLVAPADTTYAIIEVYGGGGGGGGGGDFGGGGGGGCIGITRTVPITAGETLTYSVGSGGAGGSAGNSTSVGGTGFNGATSSIFGLGFTITCNGGAGGPGGDSTGGSPIGPTATGFYGTYFNIAGGAGNSASGSGLSGTASFFAKGGGGGGNAAQGGGGGGGGAGLGNGAAGGSGSSGAGGGNGTSAANNSSAGGGGGGGSTNASTNGGSGGAGGSGQIAVYFFTAESWEGTVT